MLTLDEIKDLMQSVDASGFTTFKYNTEDCSLVLKKGTTSLVTTSPSLTIADKPISKPATDEERIVEITAPSVGTFYKSSEPGAEAFVEVGSVVKENTIVCILEAMKLFTEIEAEVSGEIVEILVKDGDFVEYGQPLFKVKTK